jgi:hypothetical protein
MLPMSKSPSTEEEDPTKGLSWQEKKRWVREKLRRERREAIAAAEADENFILADELREAAQKRSKERAEAKAAAKSIKDQIKSGLTSRGGRVWAKNEIAESVRSGKPAAGVQRHTKTFWNMQPGEMVRLVNNSEAWTEAYMIKTLPKGSIGILLDPPRGDRAAVMFGQDVFMIECKKLRPLREDK